MSAERRVWGTGYWVRGCLPHTPYPIPTRNTRRRAAVAAFLLLATTGCEWFTDFKRQPHVVTWESWRTDSLGVRGAPQGSVPLDGSAVPAWMVKNIFLLVPVPKSNTLIQLDLASILTQVDIVKSFSVLTIPLGKVA